MTRKSMRPLGALLTAGLALSACDKVDDAQNAATSGGILKGTVKDSYGKPVEGAQVVVYTYSQNLSHFYRPEEVPDTSALTDPSTYKVKVDLGELAANGEPETEIGTTGADGAFEISGLPALDGIIVVAKKNGYALDIAGVDDEGYISLDSALRPSAVDQNDLTATIQQDFVLAGGKPPFADGGGDVVPPDVTPVPPPEPPAPPAPPTVEPPPAPECLVSADCDPGEVCRAGVCGPECTEATAEVDCGADKVCREGACGPQCLGHADCAAGEICDAATMLCIPEECNAGMACDGLEQCNGEDTGHGYCAPTCTDGGGECDATNQICDLGLGGCRFECLANTDCGGDTPLCSNNHCAPAECNAHDDCLGEGKPGGYCVDFACQKECEADEICGANDRNMICDTTTSRCKLECGADAECGANADKPICENNHCAAAECGSDDDCLADDKNGGFCVANRCVAQCAADGDLAAICGDAHAECPRARCILPDPNELQPPVATSPWAKFQLVDSAGAVITDAGTSTGIVGPDVDLAKDGGIVRIVGEVTGAPAGDSIGYLRVQFGDSHCSPLTFSPVSGAFPIWLKDGKVTSDKGEFQEWVVAPAYQQLQLDLDDVIGNGNESNLVKIDERCGVTPGPNVTPKSSFTVTLGWDKDKVDADLHVWNDAGEETYYGSRLNGEKRKSAYGRIDVDDRNGFGPEVFTLNEDQTTGTFTVRARYFAGPVSTATADFVVRIIRKLEDGTFVDETFTASAARRSGAESGWVDIGVFSIGAGSAPIITTDDTTAPTDETSPTE